MLRFEGGAIGSLEATRNAWGRNNFITLEIHGTKGSIHFNYERRDELQVMFADDPADARGFRTVYTGPAHPYGGGLWPIPGLGIGYSETKIVECFDLFSAIASGKQPSPNFEDGLLTELVADALLREMPDCRRLLACGGGVHNAVLMVRLAAHLPQAVVESTAAHGLDPDYVEAMGFAWLARETLAGRPGNLPAVTGAAGPRVLGTVFPA